MRKLFPLFLLLFANTTLRAYDFRGGDLYYNITSQTAPYTVEVTYQEEYYSDDNYAGLTITTIPETVIYNDITYSVTSIGSYAFYNCSSLTSVTIPESVTSIGGGAFEDCSSLTSITIPNSVMRIGVGAFDGTGIYNDESNWENNVLYIDNCLIKTHSISGSYTIKENTRLIADYAFDWCSSLTSITIPNSVTSIGNSAFYNCSSLADVICKSIEVPMLELDVFVGMPISEATLYVPVQSLENYKAAAQWKEFGSLVPLDETPTNAVDNILSSSINTQKILRNGQLLILRDGKTYTVMGQEL